MLSIDFLLCHEVELEKWLGAGPGGDRYAPPAVHRCRLELSPDAGHAGSAVFGPDARPCIGDRIRFKKQLWQVTKVQSALDLAGRLHHSEVQLA